VPSSISFPEPVAVAAVTDGGATETVIATSGGVLCDQQIRQVTVWGMIELTTNATACTAVVVKVRRGTTAAGTQVGTTQTISATTSSSYSIPFMVTEPRTPGGPYVYSVTVAETGATNHTGTVDTAVIAAVGSSAP